MNFKPNSTSFKAGQSGNPAGRPKQAKPFRGMLLRELDVTTPDGITKMQALARRVIQCALDGDMVAAKIIRDSTDGLPVQQIDLTDARNRDARETSDAELLDIATGGSDRAAGEAGGETKADRIH